MCGIVGIAGDSGVAERLVDGLRRLEYRGYDSAGIAVIHDGRIARRRAEGKIANLDAALDDSPVDGTTGIAHTRWATHGAPSVRNAHPHAAGRVAVVHNGIIENHAELRETLPGRSFESDTDTEVVAQLIDALIVDGRSPRDAVAEALSRFRGAYALGIVVEGLPDTVFAARRGSPLAIGLGEGETYLGSDAMALAPLSDRLIYLEEGDWAILRPGGVEIFDAANRPVERAVTVVESSADVADKGQYPHYMLKEIHEQPDTLALTLAHYLSVDGRGVELPGALDFTDVSRVVIVACGTAFYAGMTARYAFEQVARLPVELDIASEFRYREPVLTPGSLFVAVSQSGETADTLAALRYAKAQGLRTLALVNVTTSTMAREADVALPICCGPEIGVASTKAFTSQVTALTLIALQAAHARGHIDADALAAHLRDIAALPDLVASAVLQTEALRQLGATLGPDRSAFFLGRGAMVPIALEGALKLKEISYIHAEGYAAGELKHGPIALIEDGTPVIVIAPFDPMFGKTASNLQEVAARGARPIMVTDMSGAPTARTLCEDVVVMPDAPALCAPVVQAVAMQLLAYHAAVALGTDVDQPRNLAKSVTVE